MLVHLIVTSVKRYRVLRGTRWNLETRKDARQQANYDNPRTYGVADNRRRRFLGEWRTLWRKTPAVVSRKLRDRKGKGSTSGSRNGWLVRSQTDRASDPLSLRICSGSDHGSRLVHFAIRGREERGGFVHSANIHLEPIRSIGGCISAGRQRVCGRPWRRG